MFDTFDFTRSGAAALDTRETALDVKLHNLEPDHFFIKQSAFNKMLRRAETAGFERGLNKSYWLGLAEGRLEKQRSAFEKGQVEGLAKGRRLGPQSLRDRINMLRRWKTELYSDWPLTIDKHVELVRLNDHLNALRRKTSL